MAYIPHKDDDFPLLDGGEGNALAKGCPYI